MASIPPKFVYSNAKAYFDGTLDPETAKRWERTVTALTGTRIKDDGILFLPWLLGALGNLFK